MRRLFASLILVAALGATTGCTSSEKKFVVEDGNCYRVTQKKTLGITHDKNKTPARADNCEFGTVDNDTAP